MHVNDFPAGEHWVILEESSINIPGDERSRTNPGHGYPESTERYLSYFWFTNEEDFKENIIPKLERRERVRGIHVAGSYRQTTTITLDKA